MKKGIKLLFFLLPITLLIISCQASKKIMDKQISKNEGEMLAYSIVGKGEIIVFIHAGGLDKKMWQNQLEKFSKNAKVISYDIRGHGGSKSVSNDQFEIEDLNTILAKEGIHTKIHLVGCSLGAIIALDYAIAFPERINKLVLVSPGLIGFQEKNEAYLMQMTNYVKAIQEGNKAAMIKELKQMNAIGSSNRTLEASIDGYVTEQLQAFIDSGAYLRIPKFKEFNPIGKSENLDMKTLIMYGDLDFDFIKKNAEKLNEIIKNAQLFEVPNAAHLLNLESEALFNEKLMEFLN
jgi:pimeloyl-ACP methyl ester carboxylesterase